MTVDTKNWASQKAADKKSEIYFPISLYLCICVCLKILIFPNI